MSDQIKKEEKKVHRDSLYDRREPQICHTHGGYTDEWGDCKYCLMGWSAWDLLGEFPPERRDRCQKK